MNSFLTNFSEITDGAVSFKVRPCGKNYKDNGYAIWVKYPNGYAVSIVKFQIDDIEMSNGYRDGQWQVLPRYRGMDCFQKYYDGYMNEPYTLNDREVGRFCDNIRKLTDDDIHMMKIRWLNNSEVPVIKNDGSLF